jgi:putative membrane protein
MKAVARSLPHSTQCAASLLRPGNPQRATRNLSGGLLCIQSPMPLLSNIAIVVVAVLHLGFLVLEMFLWTKPTGRRIFGLSKELADATAGLAMNQGLYNGFLAAGLLWSLMAGRNVAIFFLACVIVAGIFGAVTAKRSILFIQALPGVIALALVWLART